MSIVRKLDWTIIGIVFCFTLISLAALYPYSALHEGNFFFHQLVFYVIGFTFFFGLSFVNISFLKKQRMNMFILYLAGVFLLVLTLVVGKNIRGSASWLLALPILSDTVAFQPSEIMKIILMIILARYFTFKHIHLYKPLNVIISGIYVAIPALLILLQPALGSAAVLFFFWLGMVFIAGLRLRHLLIIFLLIALVTGVSWDYALKPYQKVRVLSFLNPESDPLGANYSRNQSLIAIGAGGVFGKGFGENVHSLEGFLPEAHTDFMFSMLAEGMGLAGVALILFLYGMLIWRLFSFEGKSNFDRLFASSLGLLIFVQAACNIAIALGFLPVSGLTLPFLSYGGSSLVSFFIGLGIYQALYVRS